MIDINGQETYLLREHIRGENSGYVINETDYVQSADKFLYVNNGDANDDYLEFGGTFGTASTRRYKKGAVEQRASFGLVEKGYNGKIGSAFPDDMIRNGRLGLNYDQGEKKSNLSQVYYGQDQPIFAWLTICEVLQNHDGSE